jgi:hypothetical protein
MHSIRVLLAYKRNRVRVLKLLLSKIIVYKITIENHTQP